MAPSPTFWAYLISIRKERRHTQAEMARRMNTTQGCIAKLELKKAEDLSVRWVYAYARALGLHVDIEVKGAK